MARRLLDRRFSRPAAWLLAGAGILVVAFGCELLVPVDDLHPYEPCALKGHTGQSCEGMEAGCGGDSSCCESPPVQGGMFYLSAYATPDGSIDDTSAPATVASFSLDKFEVTVGRFKSFVASGCFTPDAGAGAIPSIPGSGWDPSWNLRLSVDGGTLAADLEHCTGPSAMSGGTSTLKERDERLPINCVTWYEAFAFCIWDGGRLPTEAEWNYAAAGGALQRVYPWSVPPFNMGVDAAYARYDSSTPVAVGSFEAGASRWGQLDLAGNVSEWVLDDYRPTYPEQCDGCAFVQGEAGADRVFRGGSFFQSPEFLRTGYRAEQGADYQDEVRGFRCAHDL